MKKQEIDKLSYKIIGAAIEVHRTLGPGLLESMYHKCLKKELQLQGINFNSELEVEVNYKGEIIKTDLRCDLLVEDSIVVELKAVDKIHPICEAQLLTYMKLLKKPKGVLINFNCDNIFRSGQKTFVNSFYRDLE
jgi:GxxExxY protein